MIDFKKDESKNTGVLTLAGELNINNSGQLRDALLSSLKSVDSLVLDVTETTEIDLTGLQLLCSAHRSSIVSNKKLTIKGYKGGIVQEVADEAGFSNNKCDFREKNSYCLWGGGVEQ